jgi:3-polyprenyl-4-hydroxybenzoate decarboxylase
MNVNLRRGISMKTKLAAPPAFRRAAQVALPKKRLLLCMDETPFVI